MRLRGCDLTTFAQLMKRHGVYTVPLKESLLAASQASQLPAQNWLTLLHSLCRSSANSKIRGLGWPISRPLPRPHPVPALFLQTLQRPASSTLSVSLSPDATPTTGTRTALVSSQLGPLCCRPPKLPGLSSWSRSVQWPPPLHQSSHLSGHSAEQPGL